MVTRPSTIQRSSGVALPETKSSASASLVLGGRPESKTPPPAHPRRLRTQRGMLMADLAVAMGILASAMLPIAFIFHQELRLCRTCYYEAVALEIVDGEMEILAAGEWRAFPEGEQAYPVRAHAATNLPPGRFVLTRAPQTVTLEWRPARPGNGRAITREWRRP